jgi:hypothetical protein
MQQLQGRGRQELGEQLLLGSQAIEHEAAGTFEESELAVVEPHAAVRMRAPRSLNDVDDVIR